MCVDYTDRHNVSDTVTQSMTDAVNCLTRYLGLAQACPNYSISYLLLQLPVVSQESQKPPSPQLILVCPLSALLTLWSSVFFDS